MNKKTRSLLVVAILATSLVGILMTTQLVLAGPGAGIGQSAINQDKVKNSEDDKAEAETNDDSDDSVDAKLANQARITPDQAKAIAVSHVSAHVSDVKEVELERENGHLVYSVEITKSNQSLEVEVDAINGTVVNVEQESDDKNDDGAGETEDDNED